MGERKGLHAELERAGAAVEEAERTSARLSNQRITESRRAEAAEAKLVQLENAARETAVSRDPEGWMDDSGVGSHAIDAF